jgi:hypothetical protein
MRKPTWLSREFDVDDPEFDSMVIDSQPQYRAGWCDIPVDVRSVR